MFNVKSPDKKFANDFVDARMMQWLLQHGEGYASRSWATGSSAIGKKLEPIEIVTAPRDARRRSWTNPAAVAYSRPVPDAVKTRAANEGGDGRHYTTPKVNGGTARCGLSSALSCGSCSRWIVR